jgi:hypothetical protein
MMLITPMKTSSHLILIVMSGVLAFILITASGAAADSPIENVMKSVMRGNQSTFKLVSSGKGTDADAQKLLQYLKILPANKPPKGDLADWKTRTTKLVQAASDVVAKRPQAPERLKQAGNCNGCHFAHRKLLGF